MLLHWTIFTVNIVLATFQFLLICAVSAGLAIYSRFGGKYAHSIRWTRQGGYPEMLKSLYNSRGNVPFHVKLVMVVTILASLAATLLDKGAAHFINPAQVPANFNSTIVTSSQFSPFNVDPQYFGGWTATIREEDNIVEAVALMINNTKNIPGAKTGRSYSPRLTNYEIDCDRPNIYFLNGPARGMPYFPLSEGGCSNLTISLAGVNTMTNMTIIQRSTSRWSISAKNAIPLTTGLLLVEHQSHGATCAAQEIKGYMSEGNQAASSGGMTAMPRTITTKTVRPSGAITVLSLSTVHFSTGTAHGFNYPLQILPGENDLIRSMNEIMKTVNPYRGVYGAVDFFMEVQVVNSSIETLMCTVQNVGSAAMLQCIYGIINTFILKNQIYDAALTGYNDGMDNDLYDYMKRTAMIVEYVPSAKNISSVSVAYISTSRLRNNTAALSAYMASLGQNFYPNYYKGELRVLYDTMDMDTGLEVPAWLVYAIPAVMAVCLCLWGLTALLLDSKYTSSFYTNISSELASKTDMAGPTLMQVKINPIELEGFIITASKEDFEMESGGSCNGLLSDRV
ncbi:hypothetical protein BGZ83_011878 [Gryganskiella cystojenkinii]|nr:hypothetical protein BGZ83_011878 [Gryganskiella cystojenkinii]